MARIELTTEEVNGIPAGVKLTPMMKQYVDAKAKYLMRCSSSEWGTSMRCSSKTPNWAVDISI